MKRTLLQAAGLLAVMAFFPLKANSQTPGAGTALPDNSEIGLEQFEWLPVSDGDAPGISARFVLHNKTSNRSIWLARFTVLAKDKSGTILTRHGAALQRLVSRDSIGPNASRAILFPDACTLPGVASLELKEVYVEFSNGSLSVLKQP